MSTVNSEIQQETIRTDFAVIDVLTIGSGKQPVLLLHACGAGAKPLQKLARGLLADNRYRIVIPNLVGYGDTHHNEAGLAPLEQHLAVVEHLLTRENQQPWHLIGHSMGGFLALQSALRWPQRLRSISAIEPMAFGVLSSSSDATDIAALNEDRQLIIAFDQAMKTGAQVAHHLANFISYWNGVDWSTLPEPMQQQLLRLRQQIHREACAVSYDPTPLSVYKKLELPVQLLISEYAPLPAQRIVARLSEAIVQVQVKLISGTGHMGPLTHPQSFLRPVQEGLASLE